MSQANAIALKQFGDVLDAKQAAFPLPESVSFKAFKSAAIVAISKTPSLLGDDRSSLMMALMQCAADGLLPDGREAALVPYKGRVQYLPMVAGVLKKIHNSGAVASIRANVVYKNDVFSVRFGTSPSLDHEPTFDERGPIRCVYAAAKLKDGSDVFEVLHLDDIERIRKASRSSGSGPWVEWFDRMACKSAIHRLAKVLPVSSDIAEFLARSSAIGSAVQQATTPAAMFSPPVENALQDDAYDGIIEE